MRNCITFLIQTKSTKVFNFQLWNFNAALVALLCGSWVQVSLKTKDSIFQLAC